MLFLMNLGFAGGDGVVPPVVEGVPTEAGREGGTYAGYQKGKRRKQRIMDDDAEFILMAQSAIREILKHIH